MAHEVRPDLPVMNDEGNVPQCILCKGYFGVEDYRLLPQVLSCQHDNCFHKDCLDEWLNRTDMINCPDCCSNGKEFPFIIRTKGEIYIVRSFDEYKDEKVRDVDFWDRYTDMDIRKQFPEVPETNLELLYRSHQSELGRCT